MSCESKQRKTEFIEVFPCQTRNSFYFQVIKAKYLESDKLLQTVVVQLATDFETLSEMLFIMSNLFSKVRQTSHKPDEIYGVIERLAPGTRKIGEQLLYVHVRVYSLYRTVCIFCSGKVEVLISSNPSFTIYSSLASRFLSQSIAYW